MEKKLMEVFKATTYKLAGHGPRNLGILKEAMNHVDAEGLSDMYGRGSVIEDFENKMAKVLGKEKAVFFPSGTMAQQIALRQWCDEQEVYRVAYHPLCHLEIHEKDGLKELHQIDTLLLGEEDRLITLEDLKAVKLPLAAVLFELPQREIGGQLPSFKALKEMVDYCHSMGIRTHLDGARLWESGPYYDRALSEICDLFDSVYVSFYKGIGGVAGAILASSQDFMEDSMIWKRRYGGDLISLYPYIISADVNYEKRKDKMALYHEYALELAEHFNGMDHVRTVPLIPATNMFHVHLKGDKDLFISKLIRAMEAQDIGISPYLTEYEEGEYRFELSLGDCYGMLSAAQKEALFLELSK